MFQQTSLVFLLLTGLTLFSCSSTDKFPEKYKGEQIHFGQGGGFTGDVTYFALLDNGRLFQRLARDTNMTFLDTWPKPFTGQMMSAYHTLQLDSISYYEPGNFFYFIEHRTEDGLSHRITWGRNGFVPDAKVVNYYNLLYNSTKSKS